MDLRLLAGPRPRPGPNRAATIALASADGRTDRRPGTRSRPSRQAGCWAAAAPASRSGANGDRSPSGRRAGGRPVVLVNGAEGEPLSSKDRTLLRLRPHLVLDGALIAADAVGADRIELYIGSEHRDARLALRRAISERPDIRHPLRIVDAPATYVAGEESAAVHFVNEGDARPTTTPPRPFERGIGGRPTLVQNVESLAAAALIAGAAPAGTARPAAARRPGPP